MGWYAERVMAGSKGEGNEKGVLYEEGKTNQSERMWHTFEDRNEWDGKQSGLWLGAKG